MMSAMSAEPSDDELVRRWQAGDRAAARAFIERHHDAVVRFFFNKTGAASQQDLVQQTFLAFTSGLARLDGTSNVRAYLFGTAYRLLCKHYEAERLARERAADEPAPPPTMTSPSREIARREELRLLLRALRRIPLDYQVPLELHYWERMSTHEMSEALGLPQGTIKSRLRRGRELLAEAMSTLAESPELLKSTVDDLDRWARGVRDRLPAP